MTKIQLLSFIFIIHVSDISRSIASPELHDSDPTIMTIKTIFEVTATNPQLSYISRIFEETEMKYKLDQSRHVTVFIPTNIALTNAPFSISSLPYEEKVKILYHHVIPEVVKIDELPKGKEFTYETMSGTSLKLVIPHAESSKQNLRRKSRPLNRLPRVNGIPFDPNFIDTANGVVYITNSLIIPKDFEWDVSNIDGTDSSSVDENVSVSTPQYILQTMQDQHNLNTYPTQSLQKSSGPVAPASDPLKSASNTVPGILILEEESNITPGSGSLVVRTKNNMVSNDSRSKFKNRAHIPSTLDLNVRHRNLDIVSGLSKREKDDSKLKSRDGKNNKGGELRDRGLANRDGRLGSGNRDGGLGSGNRDGGLGSGNRDGGLKNLVGLGSGNRDGGLGSGNRDGGFKNIVGLGSGNRDGGLGSGNRDGGLGSGNRDGGLEYLDGGFEYLDGGFANL